MSRWALGFWRVQDWGRTEWIPQYDMQYVLFISIFLETGMLKYFWAIFLFLPKEVSAKPF